MLENLNKLELTNKEIELIESALSTQKKILSVQSQAGGTGARQKLVELKQLKKRIGRSRPEPKRPEGTSILQNIRGMFHTYNGCSESR